MGVWFPGEVILRFSWEISRYGPCVQRQRDKGSEAQQRQREPCVVWMTMSRALGVKGKRGQCFRKRGFLARLMQVQEFKSASSKQGQETEQGRRDGARRDKTKTRPGRQGQEDQTRAGSGQMGRKRPGRQDQNRTDQSSAGEDEGGLGEGAYLENAKSPARQDNEETEEQSRRLGRRQGGAGMTRERKWK